MAEKKRARPSLSAEQLKELYTRNDLRAVLQVSGTLGAIAATLFTFWVFPGVVTFSVAFVVIGTLQHRLSIVQHEANHYNLFRNRRLNDLIGGIAANSVGFTMAYRDQHNTHHRLLGSPEDPDDPNYRPYPASLTYFLRDLLTHVSGVAAVLQFARQTSAKQQPRRQKGARARDWGVIGVCAVQAALVTAFWTAGHPLYYLLLWIAPLVCCAKTLTHFRNLAEHVILRDIDDPELSRLRTLRSNPIERFFFAPMNFHLHAEHHFYPSIPYYNLPRAHELMANQPAYGDCVDLSHSYVSVLASATTRAT